MRNPAAATKIIDFCLGLSGFGLAGGSLYLVFRVALLDPPIPAINGGVYLSIYAKPKTSMIVARRPRHAQGVDDTPVGSLPPRKARALLTDFELIDATANAATLRTAQGRVLRVSPGAMLAGGGRVQSIRWREGQWIMETTRGFIR